jgi:hypothetical protein
MNVVKGTGRVGVCAILVVSAASVVVTAAPARGALTHRYSFNDGTANDSVGGANGTLVNGATVAGGRLVFDPAVNNGTNTDPATGQYVSLPYNILHTRAFTVEAWFTNGGGSAWQRVLDLGNSIPNPSPPPVGNIGHGFILLTTSNGLGNPIGQVSIDSWGNLKDSDFAISNSPLTVGVEHQLVYTHDPDAQLTRLFVDGVQVVQSTAHVDPSTATYSNFWMGRSQFAQDPFFNGTIDELRTYDNALTGAQVAADYAAGASAPEPSGTVLAGLVLAGACWRRGR